VQALMIRLDALARRRHRVVIGIWLAIVAVALPFAMRQSNHLSSGGFAVAGSQSSDVDATLKSDFPKESRSTLDVLLYPHKGATPSMVRADITQVQRGLHGISSVSLGAQDREAANFAAGLLEPTLLPLHVAGNEDTAQGIAETLRARLGLNGPTDHQLEMHLLGEGALWAGLEDTSKRDLSHAELIGFPIVLLVLLAIFGSLAAAMLPITLGAVAVLVTGALIYFLSLAMQLSVFVSNVASLLGIGVAVDYSLIILARVRQELHAGRDLATARHIALGTSGTAVIFSGIAVIVSLVGLWVVPNGALRSMALGAIIVVAISVIASVTLLPALITLLGTRRLTTGFLVERARRWRRPRRAGRTAMSWERWTHAVMRRPVLSIAAVGTVLLVLCIPALSLRMSTGVLSQLSKSNETRVGFNEAQKLAGVGALGPIYVMAHTSPSVSQAELHTRITQLRNITKHFPRVASIGATHTSSNGSYTFFTATPNIDPESPAAMDLVKRLRRSLATALLSTNVSVAIGGTPAVQLDEVHAIATNMWKAILAVLVMAFLILMILLRSILLPLKAIVMNLLSVGAAYGVLVVVFQWGWFDSLFHYESRGYLETLTPSLILAIVFGLSMDYEVFLLTRIKERWLATGDSKVAVAEGLAASARTISSAAFILVCVFSVFIATGVPSIKELGLGAAVAIGLDATLIRLILVPATMELLGDWNWWLPKPLERLLPTGPHEIFLETTTTPVGETGVSIASP
jgi:uncharacterized membrane protein YdfJ with MMPL/SSD domain